MKKRILPGTLCFMSLTGRIDIFISGTYFDGVFLYTVSPAICKWTTNGYDICWSPED